MFSDFFISEDRKEYYRVCETPRKELDLPFYISSFGIICKERKIDWGLMDKSFLVYSSEGCGRALINGEWVLMPKGSVLYLPSKVPVRYEPIDDNPWSTVFITFLGKFSESMLNIDACVIEGDHSYISDAVYTMKEKYLKDDFYECSNSLIYFILLKLRRLISNTKDASIFTNNSMQRISRSLHHMAESYTEDISVAELAQKCGLSEEHFCRLFKKHVGASPTVYLTSIRISRACDLLTKYPDRKIEEIASECGFRDASYFNRVFRREINMTPREFRAKNASAPDAPCT